jgi:hypothetical protein
MSNRRALSNAVKESKQPKQLSKPKDIDYNSQMGYRDDSPFRNKSSIDINTPTGNIDMSNTGIPLMANGKYLPPYSGTHQFDTNVVRETPFAEGGMVEATVDENGKPRCPDGYDYNSSTGYCEKNNIGCPEGYQIDPETGKCIEGECEPGYVKNQVGNCVPDVNTLKQMYPVIGNTEYETATSKRKFDERDPQFEHSASQTCPPNHYYNAELDKCLRYYTADELDNLNDEEYGKFDNLWEQSLGQPASINLKTFVRSKTPKKGDYTAGFVPDANMVRLKIKKQPEKILTEQVAKTERAVPKFDDPELNLKKGSLPVLNSFGPLKDRKHIHYDNPFIAGTSNKPLNWAPYSAALRAFTGYKKGDEKKYFDEVKAANAEGRPVNLKGVPLMGKTDLKHRRLYKKALKDYEKRLPEIELENEKRRQQHEEELIKLNLQRQAEEDKRNAVGLDPNALTEWKKGGGLKSKKYSRSLQATNKFFRQNPLFEKPKKLSKKRIYDPNARYYEMGGENDCPEGYEKDENGNCVWHDSAQENSIIDKSAIHPVEYSRSQLTMGDPFYNTHTVALNDKNQATWQAKNEDQIKTNLRNTTLKNFIQRHPEESKGREVELGYLHNNLWTSPTLGLEKDIIEPGYAPNQLSFERNGKHPNVYFIKNSVKGSAEAPSSTYPRAFQVHASKDLSKDNAYNKVSNEIGKSLLEKGYKGENMWGKDDEDQLIQLYGTEGSTLKGATEITPETLKYLESIKDSEEGKKHLAKLAGISEDDPDYADMLMHYNTTPLDVYAETARPENNDLIRTEEEVPEEQSFLRNTEGPTNYQDGGLTQYAPGGVSDGPGDSKKKPPRDPNRILPRWMSDNAIKAIQNTEVGVNPYMSNIQSMPKGMLTGDGSKNYSVSRPFYGVTTETGLGKRKINKSDSKGWSLGTYVGKPYDDSSGDVYGKSIEDRGQEVHDMKWDKYNQDLEAYNAGTMASSQLNSDFYGPDGWTPEAAKPKYDGKKLTGLGRAMQKSPLVAGLSFNYQHPIMKQPNGYNAGGKGKISLDFDPNNQVGLGLEGGIDFYGGSKRKDYRPGQSKWSINPKLMASLGTRPAYGAGITAGIEGLPKFMPKNFPGYFHANANYAQSFVLPTPTFSANAGINFPLTDLKKRRAQSKVIQKKEEDGVKNTTYEYGGSTDNYVEIDIPKDQIQKYVDGGYIVEDYDLSIPSLSHMDKGGPKSKKLKRNKKKITEIEKKPIEILDSSEETFDLPKTQTGELYYDPITTKEFTEQELTDIAAYDEEQRKLQKEQERLQAIETAKVNEPKYYDEGLQFVKDWHNSDIYNQMVLNSFQGNQKNADYLTSVRKKNLEDLPGLNVKEKEAEDQADGIQPAAWSHSNSGLIEVFPGGYETGPSTYVHELLHSGDRPRELYKTTHPSYNTHKTFDNVDMNQFRYMSGNNESYYNDAEGKIHDYPDWMIYKDPRFPDDNKVWHDRVIPPSDNMYVTTHRGANWKDNEDYKIAQKEGRYSPEEKGEEYWKNIMINEWGYNPNSPDFNTDLQMFLDYDSDYAERGRESLKKAPENWKTFAHDYVSSPHEVRARLGEIRYFGKKEGVYDPFTEQITPEIFQQYINKERDDDSWQPMKPINELRKDFTDEEILWMLQNISKNKHEKEGDEYAPQMAKQGGTTNYQLGDEIDEATMKRLKKLGYTFEKI